MTPMFATPPAEGMYHDGRCALWTFNANGALDPLHGAPSTTRPARRVGPGRLHRRRLPALGPARRPPGRRGRPCSRSPRRSSASAPGPTAAPRRHDPELRELAERSPARRRAAARGVRGPAASRVEAKSTPTDLVSEADLGGRAADPRAHLAARPDDGLLGEEGGDEAGTSGLRWVVDPLDGTTNFLFGIPQWAVSIAVEDADGVLAGVVYDPMRDELWAAERDGPPTLDGEPLRRPRARRARHRAGRTGFGYDADVRARAGRGRGAAARGARHPPLGRRRDRPRLDRGRALRRLLRARHQARGTSPPAR